MRKHFAAFAAAAAIALGVPLAATPASATTVTQHSFRDVEIHQGYGRLYATISWFGPANGPYSGMISGTTYDDKSDGLCVIM
ncbi:hypothetical protein ACWGCW_35735 [Streptomyces sp. NPDC054933]